MSGIPGPKPQDQRRGYFQSQGGMTASGPHKRLSTNTLLHFTPSLDNLTGILQDGLRASFCEEDLSAIMSPGNPSPAHRFKSHAWTLRGWSQGGR